MRRRAVARVAFTILASAALVVLAASCATTLGGRTAPDWVLRPPAASDQFEYFVASATDGEAGITETAGDAAVAEEAAGYSLIAQINQALGVEITVETSAEARSTLEAFEATVVQQVTQSGSGRVEGLRIADRYILERDGRTTVYLLGEYERGAFDAERARRTALLRQEEELFLGPERQADALVRDGRLAEAVFSYLQSASAAAASDRKIAAVVLERALQKAVAAVSSIQIEAVGGPDVVDVGAAPTEPVLFRLTDSDGAAVPAAPIEVSFAERRGDRDVIQSVIIATDDSGFVAFQLPPPDRVGEVAVSARLHAAGLFALSDDLPALVGASMDAFEAGVVSVRATYRFLAQSRAREIPTAVVVADRDPAGNAMEGDVVATGITQALSEAGFLLRAVAVNSDVVLDLSDADLIAYFQSVLPADIRRVVYGVAEVVDLYEDDGFIVKVRATVATIDLADGRILYTASGVKNARSRTADRAISSALMDLGVGLGNELAARLP